MKKSFILLAVFILLTSHELFIKTDAYFIKPYEKTEIFLFNGTFDISENTITRDRITKAKIIGPEYKFIPENKDYYDKANVTFLKFKVGMEGTYVAGISTLPSQIDLNAEEFNEYLDHEGLSDVIANRKKKGLTNKPASEMYSKHVKALLQVSDKRTEHFKTELNYPVEFIPLNNPYALKKGDKISFKLLKRGKPLTNQVVHYNYMSVSEQSLSREENSTRTDENGILTITLSANGKWYLATIDMVESTEKNIDYISNWATITFEVK